MFFIFFFKIAVAFGSTVQLLELKCPPEMRGPSDIGFPNLISEYNDFEENVHPICISWIDAQVTNMIPIFKNTFSFRKRISFT